MPRILSARTGPRRTGYALVLGLDIEDTSTLPPYVFGQKSYLLLEHLIDGVADARSDRAWFIVAPYGSGKSIFALFATLLLSRGLDDEWVNECAKTISEDAPLVSKKIKKELIASDRHLIPVHVHGQRASVERGLLKGLQSAMIGRTGISGWARPKTKSEVKRLLATHSPTSGDVIAAYQQALEDAGRSHTGLTLVVDEFGKHLEAAILSPQNSDIYVLQGLAELAARSTPTQFHFWLLAQKAWTSTPPVCRHTKSRNGQRSKADSENMISRQIRQLHTAPLSNVLIEQKIQNLIYLFGR